MEINWLIQIIAAIIPLLFGAVWYNENVFGKVVMDANAGSKQGHPAAVFGGALVLGVVLSFTYKFLGDHHYALQTFFRPEAEHGVGVDVASPFGIQLKELIDGYGTRFHSWTHGLAHSLIVSFFILLPVMAINVLFEGRSFKYFITVWGYWAITIAAMYMLLAQWG